MYRRKLGNPIKSVLAARVGGSNNQQQKSPAPTNHPHEKSGVHGAPPSREKRRMGEAGHRMGRYKSARTPLRRDRHERGAAAGAPRHASGRNQIEKKIKIPPLAPDAIRVIPLGGVEEIGKNMALVEYGGNIVVVDAGMQFSHEDTPGVDYILPNVSYLKENKHRIKALVITHGHLDHIGGIPYLIGELGNPPIYTREFGALLIKKRQAEFPHLPALNIRIVGKDDGALPLADGLKIRFFGLTHAIPDSSGVIVETPYGDLVFTGDVRVENHDGVPMEKEIKQYSIFKDRKILMLAMDSTGIDRPG